MDLLWGILNEKYNNSIRYILQIVVVVFIQRTLALLFGNFGCQPLL